MEDAGKLDNPVWNALAARQARFAIGDGPARRFPADVAPFLGIEAAEAAPAMAALASPGEVLTVVGVLPDEPPGWRVEKVAGVSQMVHGGPATTPKDGADVAVLGPDDAPAMLELAGLVYPAYFRPRTIEMGTYLGIRREGRLIAMAGERMFCGAFREISGVCTHPDHRGRGHASRLIARLVEGIRGEGLVPFLHVDAGNAGARGAYEKLGFALRRDLPIMRLRRVGS